jgi:hypothetical protein
MRQITYFENFDNREDLKVYGDNALLLYSLQIKYNIEDIHAVANEALLDGNDDKKIDLLYINIDKEEAIIAQGYYTRKVKESAPANKASDLNTAVTWLFNRKISDLPERLQAPAKDLREFVEGGLIKKITLWYSHNCPESKNVEEELISAEHSLNSILKANYSDLNIESCSIEVGVNLLEDWYVGITTPILVSDKIELENVDGFYLNQSNWKAFSTTMKGEKLYNLFTTYKTNLFSANIRDYLGSRKSDSNINNGIKKTAEQAPANFFVYNNGITAITNKIDYNSETKKLEITGISIVNGAQTTGAIASINDSVSGDLNIPIRIIECENQETIKDIVRFNNSQNKLEAPDFRSNDIFQKRLKLEFDAFPDIEYSSRRGSAEDVIKRPTNILPASTVAQTLAAFHNEPGIAYNEKSKIWESDKLYSKFFNDNTTGKHIFFAYSLQKAIELSKIEMVNKHKSGEDLTKIENEFLVFSRLRGALILFLSATSNVLEEILDKPIPNLFAIAFKTKKFDEAIENWKPIVKVLSSFSSTLKNGLSDGIKNQNKIDEALSAFSQLVSATKTVNESIFNDFAEKVE